MSLPKPKYPKDVKQAIAAHKKATKDEYKQRLKLQLLQAKAQINYRKALAAFTYAEEACNKLAVAQGRIRTQRITALCALCNGHGINPAPIIMEINKRPEPKTISHDTSAL